MTIRSVKRRDRDSRADHHRTGRRNVGCGGESVYNVAEWLEKEALSMEATREKTYRSPQRKLVNQLGKRSR